MGIRKWLGSKFFRQIKSVPDLRASFPLYHNGGEIWISCIDNLGGDMQLIKEKVNYSMRPRQHITWVSTLKAYALGSHR